MNLITSNKVFLKPGETKVIKTIAKGDGIAAKQPFTTQTIIAEGYNDREARTSVRVQPSIYNIGENNDFVVPVSITNTSPQNKAVGKGVKIAYCYDNFNEIDIENPEKIFITSIEETDPLDILCATEKFKHLSIDQQLQAREVLTEFSDIFSVSNDTIGRAKYCEFDIQTDRACPVSVPLRRVPLHKEQIVRDFFRK